MKETKVTDRLTDFWRAEEEEEKQMDGRTNYKLGFVSVVRLGNLPANPGWLAVDRADVDFIHGYPGLAGLGSSGSIDVDDVHRLDEWRWIVSGISLFFARAEGGG